MKKKNIITLKKYLSGFEDDENESDEEEDHEED